MPCADRYRFRRQLRALGEPAKRWEVARWPADAAGRRGAAVGGLARGAPPRRAADSLRRRSARLGQTRRDRPRHPRPPGGDHLRRDGLGQVDPVAENLPGVGPRHRRPDRPHAAPPHCRPQRGGADRRGVGLAVGPRRGLQGPLRRGPLAADLHQTDDRRHPAGRDPGRRRTWTNTTRSFWTRPTSGR